MDLTNLINTPPWEWPSNAKKTLLKTLRNSSSDASDRLLAAELAGELTVMDEEVADLLLAIVQSGAEPEQLRAKAAISLGPALEVADTEGFDDDLSDPPITEMMFQRIGETFRRIHSDESAPKEVRRRVLEAAVRAPQDWHRDAIRAAYSSDDENWKLTAVFCMQWISGFEVQILEMLENSNPEIHYEAVQAAGKQQVHAAWPHVAALIASARTTKRVLLVAIEAAAGVNPRDARPILIELMDSEDEEIAEVAGAALLDADLEVAHVDEEDDEEEEYGGNQRKDFLH